MTKIATHLERIRNSSSLVLAKTRQLVIVLTKRQIIDDELTKQELIDPSFDHTPGTVALFCHLRPLSCPSILWQLRHFLNTLFPAPGSSVALANFGTGQLWRSEAGTLQHACKVAFSSLSNWHLFFTQAAALAGTLLL